VDSAIDFKKTGENMKKVIMLFTVLCTITLNGMKNLEQDRFTLEHSHFKNLAPEIQVMIIQALNTYDNLDDIINIIKSASLTDWNLNQIINEIYSNKKFTALVDTLANKFPHITRQEIAKKFGTPIAKKYIDLSEKLKTDVNDEKPIENIIQLINEGADANFTSPPIVYSSGHYRVPTALYFAAMNSNINVVKLLLDSGANPYYKDIHNKTVLDDVLNTIESIKKERPTDSIEKQEAYQKYILRLLAIKKLLENAMKNNTTK